MRRWIGRLTFSFAALSAAFLWSAFGRAGDGRGGEWHAVEIVAGALLAVLAIVGLRLRHFDRDSL